MCETVIILPCSPRSRCLHSPRPVCGILQAPAPLCVRSQICRPHPTLCRDLGSAPSPRPALCLYPGSAPSPALPSVGTLDPRPPPSALRARPSPAARPARADQSAIAHLYRSRHLGSKPLLITEKKALTQVLNQVCEVIYPCGDPLFCTKCLKLRFYCSF